MRLTRTPRGYKNPRCIRDEGLVFHGSARREERQGVTKVPLTRHEIVGHDQERLAFRFSMLDDERIVQCQISDLALDELAGMQGTESEARLAQFLSLRDTIENLAIRLFDEVPRSPGYVVRIFSKHLKAMAVDSAP